MDRTGLEYVTQNILRATTHRVLSPRPGHGHPSTPRYSVAFFQNIGLDVKLADAVLQCMVTLAVIVLLSPAHQLCAVAPEVLALKEERVKPTGLSGKEYFFCHRSGTPPVSQLPDIHFPSDKIYHGTCRVGKAYLESNVSYPHRPPVEVKFIATDSDE